MNAARTEGQTGVITVPVADMWDTPPSDQSHMCSQLCYGERVQVLEGHDELVRVRHTTDGYTGYIERAALTTDAVAFTPPTHRLRIPATPVLHEPSRRGRAHTFLYAGAVLALGPCGEHGFRPIAPEAPGLSGWVFDEHLISCTQRCADPASIASTFLGVPYLWGGRSGRGLDCSALVQFAFEALLCPRDSDLQWQALGEHLEPRTPLQRNDVVFWPGHVGLMLDDTTMIHATGSTMMVSTCVLQEEISRLDLEHNLKTLGCKRVQGQDTPPRTLDFAQEKSLCYDVVVSEGRKS